MEEIVKKPNEEQIKAWREEGRSNLRENGYYYNSEECAYMDGYLAAKASFYERILSLEKDLESERKILFHTLEIEKVHISEIAKRDQLIEQVYPWIKDPSAIPFVRVRLQWIKQIEELKGEK